MSFLKNYKFGILFVLIFRILLFTIIIANIVYYHNWLNLFVAVIALLSTFIPDILSERNILIIPSDIKLMIIVFIFASLYLGSLRSFYYRFWWWDLMLHTAAGLNLGFIGFFSLYFINKNKHIDLILSPTFIAIFTFAFAVCLGTLWEIFEFSMDIIFGLNMQKSGLVDTMWDLIVDCIGSGMAAIISYIYLKKGLPSYFEKGIKKIFKKNIQFFEE